MAKDSELISRATSGDEAAFADLMRAYYAFVYRIVIEIVSNPHDAEEVVQDTFLNAYCGLGQIEERTRFRNWLAKIARNRALNWQREQRADTVPIDDLGESTLQAVDSPGAQLIRNEELEMVRRAMNALSQKDRDIARSYYLEGASYDELIRTHGLSYKAISFRLSRAKRTLTKRLQYLLNVVFVPPAITVKKISSGGPTAMKIGTVPKITVGVIAIIALVFIGSRQLLSPEEDSSPSVGGATSKSNQSAVSASEFDTTGRNMVTVASHADEPQISAEEMEQVEDFFAQLDEVDTRLDTEQLATTEFRQVDDERVADNSEGFAENAEQSAEEVMNAYVEAFKNSDDKAMRLLETADMKEHWTSSFPAGFTAGILEVRKESADGTVIIEDPDVLEDARLQLERLMAESILKMISQAVVVDSGYVDDEFHFRLSMPSPEVPMPSGLAAIEGDIASPPDMLFKMRKENDAWRVYDNAPSD